MERKFRTGMRSAEIIHYAPGVRRALEFGYDGIKTMDVLITADHHGVTPPTEVKVAIPLDYPEVVQLLAKLTEIRHQMAEERHKQAEWATQNLAPTEEKD